MRRSAINIKLDRIKNYYDKCGIGNSGYTTSWFKTGIRELDGVTVVDNDYQIESWFHNKATNVTKSVKIVDGDVHTHLVSMSLWNGNESVTYDRMQLEAMFDSEYESATNSDSE